MTYSRRLLFLLLGAGVSAFFSGCIGVAVKGVMIIDHKIDPPQPLLVGSQKFFGDALVARVYLRPAGRGKLDRLASLGATQEDSGPAREEALTKDDDAPTPRMAVWTTFINPGPETIEVTVKKITTDLGETVARPRPIALAPNQDVVFAPFKSAHKPNFEKMTVTVELERKGAGEVRTFVLSPLKED
jgi:hypothetical protein